MSQKPHVLEVPGELTVFVNVYAGPTHVMTGEPIASRTRRRLQITTAHGIVQLSAEQAEALRDWLVDHLPVEDIRDAPEDA